MKLYLETSLFGFWYDETRRNLQKRRAVRRLLILCRRGLHSGHVSDLVRAEIRRSPEPYRTRDLRLLSTLGLTEASYDRGIFDRLTERYAADAFLSRVPGPDLEHLALFAASGLEALVTLNLRHVANQVILEHVRKLNHENGIEKELRVASPEAFLPPRPV